MESTTGVGYPETLRRVSCIFLATVAFLPQGSMIIMVNDGDTVRFQQNNGAATTGDFILSALSKEPDDVLTKTIMVGIQSIHSLLPHTFGQEAVGYSFNPSGDDAVATCKQGFATLIDQMDTFRNSTTATAGQKRHASVAITDIETAQMRAVKALTWRGK